MFKKLLSIMLCLVMVLTLVPANVFADSEEPAERPSAQEQVKEDPAKDGEPAKEDTKVEETTEQPAEGSESPADASKPTQSIIDTKDGNVSVKGALPEGTTVEAKAVEAPAPKRGAKSATKGETKGETEGNLELNSKTSDDFAAVYDIKLKDTDGNEIQPSGSVKVTIENVNISGSAAIIYHILEDADAISAGLAAGTAEAVTSGALYSIANDAAKDAACKATGAENTVCVEVLVGTVENGTVTFEATSFSIYVIGEQGKERRTYNFYVNGELNSTQIVKNGEELIEPEHPQTAEHQEFVGWNTSADGSGTYQTFGAITGIVAEGETVDLYAVFETVYYVTFYEEDNTTVLETRKAKASNNWTVDISDLSVVPQNNEQGFFGWSLTPNDSNNIEAETYTTNDHDVDLYPVIENGYWLRFDENDGGSGGGASFTPPKFYKQGQNTVAPQEPTRKGYRFDGWYTGAPSTDGANPTGRLYGFNASLTQDTTLYAKWTATESSYSIIIWKQRVTDTVGMSDSEKSYDFEGSIVFRNVSTGSEVSVPQNPYRQYDGQENVQIGENENTSNFIGFHLGRYDSSKVVLGDGSTVLNVYYDRNVITINFNYPADSGQSTATYYVEDPNGGYYFYNDPWDTDYYARGTGPTPNARLTHHKDVITGYFWSTIQIFGWPAHTHYYYTNQSGYYRVGTGPDPSAPGAYSLVTGIVSGTDYPDDETWQGLFGQSFEDAGKRWPSTYEVKYYQSDGSYITNTINTLWKEPDQNTSQGTMPGTVLVFLDSFILPDPSETTLSLETTSTGNVTVGFYQEGTDGSYPDTATNDVHTSGGQFLITDKYAGFHAVRYRVLRNGSWSEVALTSPDSEGVYARVNSGYSELRIYYERTQYSIEFINDSEGQVDAVDKKYGVPLADLTTPTVTYPGNASDADHYTFVGWFADPDLTTYVFFDRDKVETDWAGLQYDWELTNYTVYDTMPSHNFAVYAGWFKSWFNVRLDANGGSLPEGQRDSFWVQYGGLVSGTSLNQTTREGYTLIGWRVGSVDGDPWDFDNGVTESMTLVAVWRYNHILTVEYDAAPGTDAPSDDAVYDDGASAPVTLDQPTPPEGKFFIGWKLNDQVYYAGDTFVVSSTDAVNDVVTLTAVYAELSTTSITFMPNYSGPEPIIKDLAINEAVDLQTVTFDRPNYTLIGWDTDPNATEPAIRTTDSVAADNADPTQNILYAIWEENTVGINYIVVGPDGTQYTDENAVGQLTRYSDADVKVLTGTVAANVAAPASDVYYFIGWFTDPACAEAATEANGDTLTPTQINGVWTERTYYAKFEYNYTSLTITKSGSSSADANQSYLFHIVGAETKNADVDITVSVVGNGSVTVVNLPVGKYTITEIEGWSWRYSYQSGSLNGGANQANGSEFDLTVVEGGNTLLFTNTRTNPYWLGGDSVQVNDFVSVQQTKQAAVLPEPVRIKHDGEPVEA